MEKLDQFFATVVERASETHGNLVKSSRAFDVVGIGADGTSTTNIDKQLEDVILATVLDVGLSCKVVSEEAGVLHIGEQDQTLLTLVIDPLDGTSNAAMGFPYYALSIGVVSGTESIAALVYNYCSGEIITAFKGVGAFLDGKRIMVNSVRDIKNSRLVLSKPFSEREAPLYSQCILASKRVRMTGCPSLDVVSVATGTFMGYVDFHFPQGVIKTHDILAAKLILEESEGLLMDEYGVSVDLRLDVTSQYNIFAVNCRHTLENLYEIFSPSRKC